MNSWLILGFAFLGSYVLTGLLRSYALRRSLIDIPNERGSHVVPTPRGGGLSIALICLIGYFFIEETDEIKSNTFFALWGGSAFIALLGFIDDHGHIAPQVRLSAHFIAAAWSLFWLGGMSPVPVFPETTVDLGLGGHILALIAVVWLLNLYNFMDGIDGIASVETLFVASSAAFLLWLHNATDVSIWLALIIVGTLGFILWNWPPAKVFMGDVGSGFLGFVLGVFAVFTANEGYLSVWVWWILLGVFLIDATVTMLRRLFRGERVYLAHRSHAYQNLSRRWNDHRAVTLSVLVINLVWLFPLAWLASTYPGWGILLTFIAFLPLVVLAFYLGAGVRGMYEK